MCMPLETPTSWVIARVTSNRVQWQGHVSMPRLDPASIYATRKSPEISQLWDHEMARKQGYALVTKLSPHICAYIVFCTESGIGITCSLYWSTHEIAHVTPLYYHTLVLHWAHSMRRMKQPLWSYCFATHSSTWNLRWLVHNTVPVHKDIILPYICMTWVLHWSTHETGHVNQWLAKHWNYMGFTLVGPWNCACKAIVYPHICRTWNSHWSSHSFAHVKPLFCYTLVSLRAHIGQPMKWPVQSLFVDT